MRNPRCTELLGLLVALLLAVGCAAPDPGKASGKPTAATRKTEALPTVAHLLKTGDFGGLDLRLAATFSVVGDVKAPDRKHLRHLPKVRGAARVYDAGHIAWDFERVAVWVRPQAERVQGLALELNGNCKRAALALKPMERLGMVQAEGPLAGQMLYRTARPDVLWAETWALLAVDAEGLRQSLQVGDGEELLQRMAARIQANDLRTVREMQRRLASSEGASAKAIAQALDKQLAQVEAPFRARATAAIEKALQIIATAPLHDALAQCEQIEQGKLAVASADGKPLPECAAWPTTCQKALLGRLERESKEAGARELRFALLVSLRLNWATDKRARLLVKSLDSALRARDCVAFHRRLGRSIYYASLSKHSVRHWAKRLESGALAQSRRLLKSETDAALTGSIRRVAGASLLARKPSVSEIGRFWALIQGLDGARELKPFLSYAESLPLREKFESAALRGAISTKGSPVARSAAEAAARAGRPVEAAAMHFVAHALGHAAAPDSQWMGDCLAGEASGSLATARRLLAEQLIEVLVLSRQDGRDADNVMLSDLTFGWPVVRDLGMDLGPSAKLHEIKNAGVARRDQREDRLRQVGKEEWAWRPGPVSLLFAQRSMVTWAHMATLFGSKELNAEAKALKARLADLQSWREKHAKQTTSYETSIAAYEKVASQLSADMKARQAPASEIRSRARRLAKTEERLDRERAELVADQKGFNERVAAFNKDRLAYLNKSSEEKADKHESLRRKLHGAARTCLEARIQAWAEGKPASEVAWLRWWVGRPTKEFGGLPRILSGNPQRLTRNLDREAVEIFRKSGKKHVGKALAVYWDRMVGLNRMDRAQRMRKQVDQYLKTFGIESLFSHVAMKSRNAKKLGEQVLTAAERTEMQTRARAVLRDYSKAMRERQKKAP